MFQFYLSSIKSSIRQFCNLVATKFQFYLSSIKRLIAPFAKNAFTKFQFYLSSIKSCQQVAGGVRVQRFNSTLVQLKD